MFQALPLPYDFATIFSELLCASSPLRYLQTNAKTSCPTDGIGVIGVGGGQGDGENKSGKSSLANTAAASEEDGDEHVDAAVGAAERLEVSGDALAPVNTNGQTAENGVSYAREAARTLAEANGEQAGPPPGSATAYETPESAPDQSTTVRMTLPPNAEAERYQASLFDVLEAWILEYLREKLHCGFLLSSQFQEYTRFLHVQHRPVTENDFILFRILGRGGFGAVNGTSNTTPNRHDDVGSLCSRPTTCDENIFN